MEIKYTKIGDYLLPNIALTSASNRPIGKYGMLHREHLKNHHTAKYNMLLLECRLNDYLADIDEQTREQIEQAMCLAEKSAPDKEPDLMAWVAYMNSAKHSAEEIVFKELIYI